MHQVFFFYINTVFGETFARARGRMENERRNRELRERQKQERLAREARQSEESQLGRRQMSRTLSTLSTCRDFLSQLTRDKWSAKQVTSASQVPNLHSIH